MAVRKVEAEIEKLAMVRDAPAAEAAAALRKALGDRVNLLVAKAAQIAREREMRALIPDLLGAFERLLEHGAARDPQCWGKNALVKALAELGHREAAPFLRGVRHIQMEPVWGGQEDTATTLRGACVLALAACGDIARGRVLRRVVDALSDPADPVRSEAARALALVGGEEGAVLLRLKARVGDREPRVVGQVFDALLAVEGEAALPFVAEFLKSPEEAVMEEAALALGASRMAAAVAVLREAWERSHEEVLLRAIGASRLEEGIAWLIDLVREGRRQDAAAALEALALHKDSAEIRGRVEAAAAGREAEIRAVWEERFR